jgi:hypothetical protein
MPRHFADEFATFDVRTDLASNYGRKPLLAHRQRAYNPPKCSGFHSDKLLGLGLGERAHRLQREAQL